MLVDLGRNDLGRVCEYGTVEVETFMAVETYSHVMHIVSSRRAAGCARTSARWTRCARSCPAGTLSGAPKVRAMQIIDELEPVKRGGYGGAIGYLSYTGDLDTCIHIRTVVVKDGVAHVQAGGGTVADAKPDYEYEESRGKAARRRARDRAGERAARRGRERSSSIDNYDSFTYNLVQYLGELGAELEVVRNDDATVDELLARAARPRRRLARARARPNEAGISLEVDAPLPRGRGPDARRLPRPPVARAGVRRRPSSATSRSTARRPRSSTTAGRSSPGCRRR